MLIGQPNQSKGPGHNQYLNPADLLPPPPAWLLPPWAPSCLDLSGALPNCHYHTFGNLPAPRFGLHPITTPCPIASLRNSVPTFQEGHKKRPDNLREDTLGGAVPKYSIRFS